MNLKIWKTGPPPPPPPKPGILLRKMVVYDEDDNAVCEWSINRRLLDGDYLELENIYLRCGQA